MSAHPSVPNPCDRVAAWVRERFGLPPSAVVLVNELACTLPGFPPSHTLIVFWTGVLTQRHHCKVFKPVVQVTPDDLPPYWMRDALAVSPGTGCDCC